MFYSVMRFIGRIIFFFLGLKIEGMDNIPVSGPVIIAPNHVSNWDPIVVGVALKRPVYFMGKASLFKIPLLGFIFRKMNAFPVHKEYADRQAIRRSLQILGEGKVLGIFPQGARNKSGEARAQSGMVMIALKSGAPIVPVACLGTGHNLPCGWCRPLIVRAGAPICLDQYRGQRIGSAGMEKISEDIMNKINGLLVK
ncbi:MAG: lysophospholipid acyltransferase family protein [Syntrophomonadaceae bacterium]